MKALIILLLVFLNLPITEAQNTQSKKTHSSTVYRNVEWTKVKGMSLKMDIHLPDTKKELYPVLVVYHGGGWLINNKSIMEQMSKYIASHSEYIVCNVDYRLLGDINNTTTLNEIIDDAFGALLWVKENISDYKGDSSKVIVTGDSAGGHLAACVLNMGRMLSDEEFSPENTLFRPSYIPEGKNIEEIISEDMLKVEAAILSYGAFDLYATCYGGGFESSQNFFWQMGGAEARGIFGAEYNVDSNPELYKAVSPIYNIPKSEDYKLPPMLFTVGSRDNTTTPQSIKKYIEKVNEAGHETQLWIYEDQPHAFLDSGSNEYLGTKFERDAIPAIEVMIEFLDDIFYP